MRRSGVRLHRSPEDTFHPNQHDHVFLCFHTWLFFLPIPFLLLRWPLTVASLISCAHLFPLPLQPIFLDIYMHGWRFLLSHTDGCLSSWWPDRGQAAMCLPSLSRSTEKDSAVIIWCLDGRIFDLIFCSLASADLGPCFGKIILLWRRLKVWHQLFKFFFKKTFLRIPYMSNVFTSFLPSSHTSNSSHIPHPSDSWSFIL